MHVQASSSRSQIQPKKKPDRTLEFDTDAAPNHTFAMLTLNRLILASVVIPLRQPAKQKLPCAFALMAA